MKFFGSTAVILLVIVVKDALSDCPEGGCECGKFCVDINNRWCNSNNDRECSCKKGCLKFDRLLMPDEELITIYCVDCFCADYFETGHAFCAGKKYCLPKNLTVNVDYPASEYRSPNCNYSEYDALLDDFEETTEPQ